MTVQSLQASVEQLKATLDSLTAGVEKYLEKAAPDAAISVAVVNESTVMSDQDVENIVTALQIQVVRDFYPWWGTYAKLTFVPKGQVPNAKSWQLVFLDDADMAGALGYHDVTSVGQPLGKVFVKTTLSDGQAVSTTASHELLEMLGDPEINLTVFVQDTNTAGRLYAYEVCDACEADEFGYEINGVLVSDFVLPSWFDGAVGPYDFQNHISAPLELLAGGFISIFDVTKGGGWTQLNADLAAARRRPVVGSRRERRRTPREQWLMSTTPVSTEPLHKE